MYARKKAVICLNSLTDFFLNNSFSVYSLKSIIAGKRHCGIFIDSLLSNIDKDASGDITIIYTIPYDIIFSAVLDLS